MNALCLASGCSDLGGLHASTFRSFWYKMNCLGPYITLINKPTAESIIFLILWIPPTLVLLPKILLG